VQPIAIITTVPSIEPRFRLQPPPWPG